mgnify:FL=1
MDPIFIEITVVLIVASLLSILFKLIKQPPILAYILTGIVIGPLGLLTIENRDVIRFMAEIGITLLLFMLGLELKIRDLKSVGKTAVATGIGQIVFTSVVGFAISQILGFTLVASIYIAIALTFSSTIIIVKLLSDKKDLNSLYGKISVGLLLVQDLFAIIALIILSGFSNSSIESVSAWDIGLALVKGAALFLLVLILSRNVLPRILKRIAQNREVLFLFSIAWAFGVAALVSSAYVGLSIEIGGLLAGLALANSEESFHISSRTRSLRDFFIIIFFVTLGMGMVVSDFGRVLVPGIILSIFVVIGNPLIMMMIMGLLGHKKRTSFLAGLTVAQISEFSLILIFLGNRIGHLSDEIVSLITFIGITTFAISTYLIMNGNFLYKILSRFLDIFERENIKSANGIDIRELKDHIVLAGVNRAGESILKTVLKEGNSKIIAVDFNPDVVANLKNKNTLAVFGDVADIDIINQTKIDQAKIVISTVSDIEDNLHLIKAIKSSASRAKIIMIAPDREDAMLLYKAGADYVVVPHFTSGEYIAKILKDDKIELLDEYRARDIESFTLKENSHAKG